MTTTLTTRARDCAMLSHVFESMGDQAASVRMMDEHDMLLIIRDAVRHPGNASAGRTASL